MRCRECNVDLPKEYTACPLCGAKVYDDEPQIQGIRLAEYPKVETEKYKRNPFTVFLVVWAVVSAISFALLKLNVVSNMIFASAFCIVPLLWTLIVRPATLKQLYKGNYIVMNIYPVILACAVFAKFGFIDKFSVFTRYMPVASLVIMLALMILIMRKPATSKRAAPYTVLMGISAVITCVISSLVFKVFVYEWLVVSLVSFFMLLLLIAKNKRETVEELKAKFSIQ